MAAVICRHKQDTVRALKRYQDGIEYNEWAYRGGETIVWKAADKIFIRDENMHCFEKSVLVYFGIQKKTRGVYAKTSLILYITDFTFCLLKVFINV